MNTNVAAVEIAEEYVVTFKYWVKKGARRSRTEGHNVVMACSASEAIGMVAKRWESDKAAEWQLTGAKSMRAIDDEAELRRRDRAYANSHEGQAAACAAALARIRADRAALAAK